MQTDSLLRWLGCMTTRDKKESVKLLFGTHILVDLGEQNALNGFPTYKQKKSRT